MRFIAVDRRIFAIIEGLNVLQTGPTLMNCLISLNSARLCRAISADIGNGMWITFLLGTTYLIFWSPARAPPHFAELDVTAIRGSP